MIYFASSTSTVFKFLHASLDPASCLLAAIYDSLLAFPHLFYHIFPPLDSTRDLVTVHLPLSLSRNDSSDNHRIFWQIFRQPLSGYVAAVDDGYRPELAVLDDI